MTQDEEMKVVAVEEKTFAESDFEDYFAMYDDVACEVLDDQTPNRGGFARSNAQIAESVCQIMQWESFDMMEEHDFPATYAEAEPSKVLAYAMIAYLRGEVFRVAEAKNIGFTGFNQKIVAHSEVWHTKLSELWAALRRGEEVKHKWVN